MHFIWLFVLAQVVGPRHLMLDLEVLAPVFELNCRLLVDLRASVIIWTSKMASMAGV